METVFNCINNAAHTVTDDDLPVFSVTTIGDSKLYVTCDNYDLSSIDEQQGGFSAEIEAIERVYCMTYKDLSEELLEGFDEVCDYVKTIADVKYAKNGKGCFNLFAIVNKTGEGMVVRLSHIGFQEGEV